MSMLNIEEPAAAPSTPKPALWQAAHPLWRLGFRPFYLLTAAFAALAVPLWIAQYFGWLQWPAVTLQWHMHEMVFGMAVAVVVGFLFTAGRAWTGLPTPHGHGLAALAALWLGGRIALLVAPGAAAAALDLAFLPLAAWCFYRVLHKAGNRRNMFLVALLGLLTLCNALFHAAALGWLALSPLLPAQAAILIVVLIESVIGTRIIPMFTANGAPGSKPVVKPLRDRIALGLVAAASLAWIAGAPAWLSAPLAAVAGVLTALRVLGWQPQRTLRIPLLWILHLSYGWIAVGFMLLALAALGWVSISVAFHALTVGSMAGLILGMMTRTALGHTGRPLKAGRAETTMYALIQLGALARVAAGINAIPGRDGLLIVAASAWALAFLLYLAVYVPYLSSVRVDGREG